MEKIAFEHWNNRDLLMSHTEPDLQKIEKVPSLPFQLIIKFLLFQYWYVNFSANSRIFRKNVRSLESLLAC